MGGDIWQTYQTYPRDFVFNTKVAYKRRIQHKT